MTVYLGAKYIRTSRGFHLKSDENFNRENGYPGCLIVNIAVKAAKKM